ncbi:hypothetical protein GE09DRAFT_1106975 [Coniochaeta sp. 2T2.1]|nr:hypothetical protein GE09DRAFT_1106975 [Coniochaeta sp. 2T2.1]
MYPNVDMHWLVMFLPVWTQLPIQAAGQRDLAIMTEKTGPNSPCSLSTGYVAGREWTGGKEERRKGDETTR